MIKPVVCDFCGFETDFYVYDPRETGEDVYGCDDGLKSVRTEEGELFSYEIDGKTIRFYSEQEFAEMVRRDGVVPSGVYFSPTCGAH